MNAADRKYWENAVVQWQKRLDNETNEAKREFFAEKLRVSKWVLETASDSKS